jgi:hypothetical protein
MDDLRQTRSIQGQNIAPQIEFFFAPANKRLALAGFDRDLLWFLFLFGKRKRRPSKEQNLLRTASRLPLKIIEKDSFEENQNNPMTILG